MFFLLMSSKMLIITFLLLMSILASFLPTTESSSSSSVNEKPVINPFLFGSNLREGMRTSVLCSVISGDSPLTITWYKDDQSLTATHPDVEIINLGEFTSTLRIGNVRRDHSGNYTCQAATKTSSASYSSEMVVQASPRWILKPSHDYSVLQGRNLIIDCQTQGYPMPIHQWRKKIYGHTSSSSSTHLRLPPTNPDPNDPTSKDFAGIVSGPHMHVLENGSLVILDAEKSDEGEYICGSSNVVGNVISNPVYVKVHSPAHFKKNFDSVKTRVGQRVELTCEGFGDDHVKMTWSRDGQVLSNSYSPNKKYVIQENLSRSPTSTTSYDVPRMSRLTMESVDLVDSGFYVCTATNVFGKDDMNIELVVQGPPNPPSKVRATEISGRRILVEWKDSGDGNSPLIEYILNYRKSDGPWNQETESIVVGSKETSIPITGLRPNTVYKLRIFAKNSLGKSLPSEELLVKTEEEAPSDVASNVRIESLSSKSLRVHWIFPSTDHRNYDGFYVGFRDVSLPPSSKQQPSSEAKKAGQNTYTFKTIELAALMSETTGKVGQQVYKGSSPGLSDFHATITDLKRNSRYAIIVQAFNRKGPGPSSEEVMSSTAEFDAPSKMSLRVSPLDHHSLSISWESDEETPISGYVVSYKNHLDNWEELKMVGKRSSHVLDNLRCGTKYQITAVAYNKAGRSKASDVVSAATAGNVPSAPSFDSLVKTNATTALVDLSAWADNGCPIMYFVVQYKEHFLNDWIMLSNNIIPEQSKVYISDLVSSTWYDLSMIAHSEAGSSEAQYLFSTLTPAGATISPLSVTSDPAWEVALYDPVVVAPIVCTCFVLIVVIGTIGYFSTTGRRIQTEDVIDNYSTIGSRKMESLSMNSLRVKSVSGAGTGSSGCVLTTCDDSVDDDNGKKTVYDAPITDGRGFCTYYASPFIPTSRGGGQSVYHQGQNPNLFVDGSGESVLTPQSAEATAFYALHKDIPTSGGRDINREYQVLYSFPSKKNIYFDGRRIVDEVDVGRKSEDDRE